MGLIYLFFMYSFLLEADSTPGPYCSGKDYINDYPIDPIGNRTGDLPACSAVLQPTAPTMTVVKFKGQIIVIQIS